MGAGLRSGQHRRQTVLHRGPGHRRRRGGSLHRGRSRRALHARDPAGTHPELDAFRAEHHPHVRRRQGAHRVHRTYRQGSGAAGRHDPDHRGAGDRGGCRQRRLLGRARRRRPGHRQRVRPSRGQARGGTRGRPHRRIQRHVHGPLPVEPAVRLPAHRAEEACQRHPDRRRRRLRRHSGIRRGRGTHPQPQRRRLPVRELQAGHRRPDPPGGAHRQGRRANQGAHRGRRRFRRRPPLLGIA